VHPQRVVERRHRSQRQQPEGTDDPGCRDRSQLLGLRLAVDRESGIFGAHEHLVIADATSVAGQRDDGDHTQIIE